MESTNQVGSNHSRPGRGHKETPDLFHLQLKAIRQKSHEEFLSSCLSKNVTPKGMKLRFGFSGLPASSKLKEDISQAIQKTEKNIIHLCKEYYTKNSTVLRKQFNSLLRDCEISMETHQLSQLKQNLKKHDNKNFQKELTKKRKKMTKLTNTSDNCAKSKFLEVPDDTEPIPEHKKKKNRRFRKKIHNQNDNDSDNQISKQVVNISSFNLSENQIRLLTNGPKFCPTPSTYDAEQLLEDTTEGLRKIRLKEYFLEENTPSQLPTKPKFYKKTFWEPPKGRDKSLEAYCSTIMSKLSAHVPTPIPLKNHNLSKGEKLAMNELKTLVQNKIIRISPADKGGAMVVQDFDQYIKEAKRQLDDKVTYEKLDKNPTIEICKESNNLVDILKSNKCISEKCEEWARTDPLTVRTHLFYHLPKIHKRLENPPGRPIVSGVNGPTEKLSRLVDHWLQPVVQKLPSFLKDSTHLLQLVKHWNEHLSPLPPETLLVTIDVVALYPSIPIEEVGPAVIENLEDNRPSEIPDNTTLIKIIEHVLQNNIFEFNGEYFKQLKGTAMGTPMAPTIANLFMGTLEKKLLNDSPWQIDIDSWRRFIDDILILWRHGKENLEKFIEWLNNQHDSIKFTASYGHTEIPYLDISLSIVNGIIETDLYKKPTDANMILPFKSCHPAHCKRGIPYGQCLRLRRICSKDSNFNKRTLELKQNLMKRGYPQKLVNGAIEKVAKKSREEVLQYKHNTKENTRVPVIITHNPTHPPLSSWFKEGMNVLHNSRRMQKALPKPPMIGERNSKNLRNILMPSAIPSKTSTNSKPGCFKCKASRCVLCKDHLVETTTFKSARTNQTFTIRENTTCKSSNLVYLVDCAKCKDIQYVGETGQTVQKRFHGHRSDIRNVNNPTNKADIEKHKKETLVARHFQGKDHSLEDLRVTVIELLKTNDIQIRKARERYWRHKLKTNYPDGLNVWD